MNLQLLLQQQQEKANLQAAKIKSNIYGVTFEYQVNNEEWKTLKTKYKLKTIEDLMDFLSPNQIATNLKPFDEENNLLGYSVLLSQSKKIYIKSLSEKDMVYIYFIGKNNNTTYCVNKQECKLKQIVDIINKVEVFDLRNVSLNGKPLSQLIEQNQLLSELIQENECIIQYIN